MEEKKERKKICLKLQVCTSSPLSSGEVKDDALSLQNTYFSFRLIEVKKPTTVRFPHYDTIKIITFFLSINDGFLSFSPLCLITGLSSLTLLDNIVFLASLMKFLFSEVLL